jgi:Protein of unknown function, DUF481
MGLPPKIGAAIMRKFRTVFGSLALSAVCFLSPPLLARERTDVLVMKNGDRLTCEIKALSSDTLTISLDYVKGDVSLQWAKVARLETNRLFIVQTQDGSVYTGKLSTIETKSGQPAIIRVELSPAKQVELEQLKVVRISETSQNFWQRFNGDVETGIDFSKGNDSTQYSLGAQIEYPRARWVGQASFNSSLSANSKSNNSTRNQFDFGALRLLRWNNWFYRGIGSLLQSSVQGIHLQTTLGGGIGHYFLNTNHTTISLTGGFAWENTIYDQATPPEPTQNLAVGLVAAQAKFFKFKKTSLDVTGLLIPAISEPGRVHINSNASYYIRLFSDLSWNFSVYGSWDNRAPPGFSGTDYGTSSGLSWKFGNR